MQKRAYALFGAVGPVIAYLCIGVSITFSPWFSWEVSALSDLGHSVKSEVAPIFNLGLLLCGFLVMIYAVVALRKHAKYTRICFVASALLLQLISTFDEVYGFLHFAVSVLFFVSIGITSIVYAVERKSSLAVTSFMIVLVSWSFYGMKMFKIGLAVPEIISSLAVASFLIHSALNIFLGK